MWSCGAVLPVHRATYYSTKEVEQHERSDNKPQETITEQGKLTGHRKVTELRKWKLHKKIWRNDYEDEWQKIEQHTAKTLHYVEQLTEKRKTGRK
jgi:hypothetical protein